MQPESELALMSQPLPYRPGFGQHLRRIFWALQKHQVSSSRQPAESLLHELLRHLLLPFSSACCLQGLLTFTKHRWLPLAGQYLGQAEQTRHLLASSVSSRARTHMSQPRAVLVLDRI